MYKTADFIMGQFPGLRRFLNRIFYQYLAGLDATGKVKLMNYGYASATGKIPLQPQDEPDRCSLQLYHRVASAIDLNGRDVLEVGSGRGGGASYIMRYLKPRTMTGMDYSSKAVAFCQRHYADVEGLQYRPGDAEDMPFEANSFDVVVNVESSHCYGSMENFVNEAGRVLRPGGYFLWTDHRPPQDLSGVYALFERCGFEIQERQSITENVLAALDYQRERNRALIDDNVPPIGRHIFYSFAGVEGTLIHDRFRNGELEYVRLVMRKAT
ncbi:MAG: class I SAM-dependent methyltransferase [Anaerolineales bacterium]|nr:class I SAM-dependent methyltransferase [Anaerolineales bacterium]